MSNDDFWSSVYSGVTNKQHGGRFSAVRMALLFGIAAIALALVVPPLIDFSPSDWRRIAGNAGIDYTTTATAEQTKEYTLQRSILQPSMTSVCIIERDGRRTGDC